MGNNKVIDTNAENKYEINEIYMGKTFDNVENPHHYTSGKIEVIDFIEDKGLGFCLGNVIKYVSRAGKKHSVGKSNKEKEIEDLKKARWYLDRRIKELEESETETIENEHIKTAHWIISSDGYYPYCSNCKNEPNGKEMTEYCPKCGYKMLFTK